MNDIDLVLIGMPGAGKSSVGVLLAKTLCRSFIDTDLLIQEKEKRLLQRIIAEEGVGRFLEIEQSLVLRIPKIGSVIATGGSVVYGEQAMRHLKTNGRVYYLQAPLAEIERRVQNMGSRGIAIAPNQTLSDLYRERIPLYERYADVTVDCQRLEIEEILKTIVFNYLQAAG